MSQVKDEDLYAAAQRLGEATRGCTEDERAVLRKLYADVKEFSAKQGDKGIAIDKSAFFAAGIIFHPDIQNESLLQAAVDYIDKDYLFVKSDSSGDNLSAS